MDPITIALLVAAGGKGVTGLAKGITGAVQKSKANKELEKEFPKYSRPEEFDKMLGLHVLKADDYITKPFSRKELIKRTKELLGMKLQ